MGAVKLLILPPGVFVIGLIVGLGLLSASRQRWGRRLLAASLTLLVVFSMPVVGQTGLKILSASVVGDATAAEADEQAIVVLGGTFDTSGPVGEPGALTLERLYRAVVLKRTRDLPIAVTAGPVGDPPEPGADIMARALQDAFATPVRWREAKARNTWENAVQTAALLGSTGVRSVYLVTHGWHLPRAVLAFEANGLVVTPVPVHEPSGIWPHPTEFLPSAGGMLAAYYFTHELMGLAWYRMVYPVARAPS